MGFILGLKGIMAFIIMAILGAIGTFLGKVKVVKIGAWVGVAVVAVIAAWNEIKS